MWCGAYGVCVCKVCGVRCVWVLCVSTCIVKLVNLNL